MKGESGERWAELSLILPLFLFGLGYLPRLLALDAFLTADEYYWVRRSRSFLLGLLKQDWAATLQTGHPGVTTMWTGSLGILYRYWTRPSLAADDLLTFVRQVPSNPVNVAYVAPMRLPTVILTSLTVVVFFCLATRLFGQRTALIASCLFALNPLHIGLSRVLHHDALATTFMTLSLLAMIGYWLHGWGRRWLLVSSVMAGLAFLSKSSAMVLLPFSAIVGVWTCVLRWRWGERKGWQAVGRLVLDGTLWTAVAWLTYALLWPAIWAQPAATIATVFSFARRHVDKAHVLGQYFLGEYVQDPGPLFYPLVWLLRTTPLNLLGLGALLLPRSWRKRPYPTPDKRRTVTVYLCLVYVLLYVAMMTLGSKKQERYILPVFPVLDLLAGLGLVGLWQIIRNQWPKAKYITQPAPGYWPLAAGVIIVQALFALPHYPYYLSYYNPLLGGGRSAQRLVTVGWGEGLDLAAAYLNQKPNADQLKVAAWYHSTFAPYFEGYTTHFFSTNKPPMSTDYLVIYQNQLQRQIPDPHLLAYYQRHHTPEYVARLKGIDYALVYAVPIEGRIDWDSSRVPDKLILYGYRQAATRPGVLTIRLVWENQGMWPEDGLWAALALFEGQGQALVEDIAWQACPLAPGFSPADAQEPGSLVESECELYTIDLAPGIYSLHIGIGPSVPSGRGDVVDLLPPPGELGVSVPDAGAPSLTPPHEALDAVAK